MALAHCGRAARSAAPADSMLERKIVVSRLNDGYQTEARYSRAEKSAAPADYVLLTDGMWWLRVLVSSKLSKSTEVCCSCKQMVLEIAQVDSCNRVQL